MAGFSKLRWQVAQLCEIQWWKAYLLFKDKQRYFRWKSNYWKKFLEQINLHAECNGNKQALDAGCGPAGINIILKSHPTDALDPLLTEYQKHFPYFFKDPEMVRYFNSAIEDYVPDKLYDIIFCINTIDHSRHTNTTLQKLNSLLVPGGLMVITVFTVRGNYTSRLIHSFIFDPLHPGKSHYEQFSKLFRQNNFIIMHSEILKQGIFLDYQLIILKKK